MPKSSEIINGYFVTFILIAFSLFSFSFSEEPSNMDADTEQSAIEGKKNGTRLNLLNKGIKVLDSIEIKKVTDDTEQKKINIKLDFSNFSNDSEDLQGLKSINIDKIKSKKTDKPKSTTGIGDITVKALGVFIFILVFICILVLMHGFDYLIGFSWLGQKDNKMIKKPKNGLVFFITKIIAVIAVLILCFLSQILAIGLVALIAVGLVMLIAIALFFNFF